MLNLIYNKNNFLEISVVMTEDRETKLNKFKEIRVRRISLNENNHYCGYHLQDIDVDEPTYDDYGCIIKNDATRRFYIPCNKRGNINFHVLIDKDMKKVKSSKGFERLIFEVLDNGTLMINDSEDDCPDFREKTIRLEALDCFECGFPEKIL